MAILEIAREHLSFAPPVIAHVSSSAFVGGPERQMLGLAEQLSGRYRTAFFPFNEGGRSSLFVDECKRRGFLTAPICSDTPHVRAMIQELAQKLREERVDVLVTHTHKGDLIGLPAARKAKVPVVAVSHGWTGECGRQRIYDALDRIALRFMDAVICVSEAQARKVLRIGVSRRKVHVIHNAIAAAEIVPASATGRVELERFFQRPPRWIVGAAGRLSPEKGFEQLVYAAQRVLAQNHDVGFVVFGDGPERAKIEELIASCGVAGRFILAGFTQRLAELIGSFDLVVLPSYTEGLPVVVLEAMAAGVAVVATAVGGTPEVVLDGETGYLVPSGDPQALGNRIAALLDDSPARAQMGIAGRRRVHEQFSRQAQSDEFRRLLERFVRR